MDNKVLFEFVQWIAKHDTSGLSDEEIVKSFMIKTATSQKCITLT